MKGYILRGVQDVNGVKTTIYVSADGPTHDFNRAVCGAFLHRKDAEDHVTRYAAMCNLPNGYQKDHGVYAHTTEDEQSSCYLMGRFANFVPVEKWEILDISEVFKGYKSYKEFVDALIADWLVGRKLRYEPVKVDTKKAKTLTNAWMLEEEIKSLSDARHSVNWVERQRQSCEKELKAKKANLAKQTKTVTDLMSKIHSEFDAATSADPHLNDLIDRLKKRFNNIKRSEQE